MKKYLICAVAAIAFSSTSFAEQTMEEKTSDAARDTGAGVSKGMNRVSEEVCTGSDAKCAGRKAKNRGEEATKATKNKAKEVKDKVD
jgi:hypothetical protein